MAIAEMYSGSPTLSTAELVLNTVTPNTTAGVYQLFVDVGNMVAGDIVTIRVKEKVTSSATQGVIFSSTLQHGQGADNRIWVSPSLVLLNGWDMTLKQDFTTTTNKVVPWSIRRIG